VHPTVPENLLNLIEAISSVLGYNPDYGINVKLGHSLLQMLYVQLDSNQFRSEHQNNDCTTNSGKGLFYLCSEKDHHKISGGHSEF
jgi:hypothetical protein